MEIMNKSLREIDLKEKTFMQNKISAENDYNYSYQEIFTNYYKDQKEFLFQEIMKEMQVFLSTKLSLDDLVEEIIPEIAKREKYSKSVRELMEEKINSIRDENLDFKISHFNILIMGIPVLGNLLFLTRY